MRHLLLLPVLCVAAAAQDVDQNRFVPADSTVVVRMAAPAKWKVKFEKTQVAKLLQAATLAPMLDQIDGGVQGLLAQLRSSGKFDADLVEKYLSDYRGDIVFAVQFDGAKLAEAMANGEPPQLGMVISFGPDGSFDLGALAAAIEKAIEENDDGRVPLRDLQVGDLRLRVSDDEEMQVSVPKLVDGHIVMLVGNDLEHQAAKMLGKEGRRQSANDDSTLSVHASLGGLVSGFIDMIAFQADQAGAPFDVAKVLGDTGLAALDNIDMRIGADDRQLVADLEIGLNDKEPGLFGMVMLDQANPKLLRYLPAGAEHFSALAFDVGAIYRSIQNVWTSLEGVVPMSFGDFETMATEELKVRLKEDLLDHIGTEMMTISDFQAGLEVAATSDDEDPMAMLAGECICVSLRDGKKFGESLEKAMRARGLHAARKTEEYQGAKVHRLSLGGLVEAEYCVTDEMLLLAIGGDEASRRNLRAVLDQRASGEAAELPAKVKPQVELMAKGWSGLAVTPMASILDGLDAVLQQANALGDAPPEMEMVLEVLHGLGRDMRRLGLENMVQTTHSTKRMLKSHLRW
ncbi:MAG: hypothetical protein H6838_00960 [Planctomycetes bacterium]|nr:hypothetical protein [Planctomycetota bacterium]MCB9884025.1 hypothetical protein [Planctomycetota bacterium]